MGVYGKIKKNNFHDRLNRNDFLQDYEFPLPSKSN